MPRAHGDPSRADDAPIPPTIPATCPSTPRSGCRGWRPRRGGHGRRWRPTGATPVGGAAWLRARGRALGDVDEADIEAYVAELRAADLAPATVARAVVAVRSLHRFLAEEGRAAARPRRPGRDAPRARRPAQGAQRARGRGPHRRGGRGRPDRPRGTGPSSRCSTAPGCASPSWWACGWATSTSSRRCSGRSGRGAKERVVPVGRPAVAALGSWLGPGGRPALVPERWARRSDADAVFLNRRGGRLTRQGAWLVVKRWGDRGGPRGPAHASRPAALVRHAHARPRRRHPIRPGAARSCLGQHHAGVHEGVGRTPGGGVPRRPPAGSGRGPVNTVRTRGGRRSTCTPHVRGVRSRGGGAGPVAFA